MGVSVFPHLKSSERSFIKPRIGKGRLLSYMLVNQTLRLGNGESENSVLLTMPY